MHQYSWATTLPYPLPYRTPTHGRQPPYFLKIVKVQVVNSKTLINISQHLNFDDNLLVFGEKKEVQILKKWFSLPSAHPHNHFNPALFRPRKIAYKKGKWPPPPPLVPPPSGMQGLW